MKYDYEPHNTLQKLLKKYSFPYIIQVLYQVVDDFIFVDYEEERNQTIDQE